MPGLTSDRDKLIISDFQSCLRVVQEEQHVSAESIISVKNRIVALLPEMRRLADQKVGEAQYYFAKAHPRHSKEYVDWMKAASGRGVVDAHYALGNLFLEAGDLNKASAYYSHVLRSYDRFLKDEVKEQMHQYPRLETKICQVMESKRQGFFSPPETRKLLTQSKGKIHPEGLDVGSTGAEPGLGRTGSH